MKAPSEKKRKRRSEPQTPPAHRRPTSTLRSASTPRPTPTPSANRVLEQLRSVDPIGTFYDIFIRECMFSKRIL